MDLTTTSFPQIFSDEGWDITLWSSFLGIKGIPLLALGHNSLNTRLTLYSEKMACRVFRLKEIPYGEVESVAWSKNIGTRLLTFNFKNKIMNFSANVFDEEDFLKAIRFLELKNLFKT